MNKLTSFLVTVSLIISILIGLTLSRGKSGPALNSDPGNDGIVIGLSMDTLKEARWQRDRDLFVERVEALGGKVQVVAANSDDTQQMRDVEALITNKVDVIVIIPHDGTAMAKAVRLAQDAGIPVISYDRLIMDSEPDLYITFDNVKVGELQARYLIDHLPTPGKGKIVRIYGAPTDNNAKLFKKGQDNVLNPLIEKGDIEVMHEDWALNWEPQNAKKIINAAITNAGTGFDAILASNDGTAGGAVQSLKEEGLAGEILVTGQDADLVACQRIAGGTQTMTIYKPVKALATGAAELAVKMASGKPIIANSSVDNRKTMIPSVLLEVIALDKDNLQVVIDDGFHSREDIFRKNPDQ